MMTCTDCDNEDTKRLVWPDGSVRDSTDVDNIAMSYGLCLSFDEFIEDKCIWIADLSNGIKVFQDDDRPGQHVPSAWRRLGYYFEDYKAKIVKWRLRFGTNVVELPDNRPYYFYSRGLLQAIQQSHGLDFHIVGWPIDKSGNELELIWFKVPELAIAERRTRFVRECEKEQLVGIDKHS